MNTARCLLLLAGHSSALRIGMVPRTAAVRMTADAAPASVPTSKVISDPKDWCDMSILFAHEALRQMIVPMEHMKIDTPEKASTFNKWYNENFYPMVDHHHHAEEDIYFPWIAKKVDVPDKMAKDHVGLLDDMNTIKELAAKAVSGNVREEGPKVEMMLRKFGPEMLDHLAEEEELVPALLRASGYKAEDEGPMVGEIMASIADCMDKFMPLLAERLADFGEAGLGGLNKDIFMSTLPPPAVEAYPAWLKVYNAENKGAIEVLTA